MSACALDWTKLFGVDFQRARYGDPPNAALNYGYTLIRTSMARALISQGLILSLGVHHHNRYNSFCLVDDIMEPYRPFVDLFVWQQHQASPYAQSLTQDERETLLLVGYSSSNAPKTFATLHRAIEETAITLVRTLQERRQSICWGKITT